MEKLGTSPADYEIIHEKNPARTAAIAADVVRQGRASILIKGGEQLPSFCIPPWVRRESLKPVY
ncbi:MAG: hypothetical protein JW901_05970 [Dehalococcoidia bacterium]|nr:hypothetical protein [Dehalococcoidia bacterium]